MVPLLGPRDAIECARSTHHARVLAGSACAAASSARACAAVSSAHTAPCPATAAAISSRTTAAEKPTTTIAAATLGRATVLPRRLLPSIVE